MNRSKIKQEIIGETEWSPSTVKCGTKSQMEGHQHPHQGGVAAATWRELDGAEHERSCY